jgi:hypothetical protein
MEVELRLECLKLASALQGVDVLTDAERYWEFVRMGLSRSGHPRPEQPHADSPRD